MNNGSAILRSMGRSLLIRAQGGICPGCGHTLDPFTAFGPDQMTVEHVWPKSKAVFISIVPNKGNIVLTHWRCNNEKADRAPKPCEVLFLFAVNRRLGYTEAETAQWDRP